ncbi:alpha/beta hydrolase family protein [Ornithinimicrobium cavernae]|uniref:alpha/beta hydrolase family protein n=1 Tax=Ornithinimicrobium cavernae TaxID=2666047 RepID=UPI000D691AC4|nr:prolyl oligopeptidase family serine peptidase [Ornithinimicrobium cavernae]
MSVFADIAATQNYVDNWLAAAEGPALGVVSMITGLQVSSDGAHSAGVGRVIDSLDQRSTAVVTIVNTSQRTSRNLALRPTALAWAGTVLGVGGTGGQGAPTFTVVDPAGATLLSTALPGPAQHVAGYADQAGEGARFAVVCSREQPSNFDVAPPVAARVLGQAATGTSASHPPQVYTDEPQAPRTLTVVDAGTGTSRQVDLGNREVWSVSWIDADHLVAIVSDQAGETGWYTAYLGRIHLPTGQVSTAYRPVQESQLAYPLAHAGRLLVIEGIASDRNVVAGDVIVIDGDGTVERLHPAVADVTALSSAGDVLGYLGLRGLSTVAGRIHLGDGAASTSSVLWQSTETMGANLGPSGAFDERGRLHGVCESFTRYPQVVVVTESAAPGRVEVDTVLDLRHPGADAYLAANPRLHEVSWTAPDGLRIEGLLVTPAGEGPFPLLVNVHGGPVSAWRNRWGVANFDRYPYVTLLAARGYASFYPNPRGSQGRGQDFINRVRGDMVGADVDDIISGVDHLARQGLVDPTRVAVTGNSYGGMMAAWLAVSSDRFAAAIPTSPSVDMVSQHYCSDIPDFDRLFVRDDVHAVDGEYRSRSAIHHVAGATTPTLLTAGLLDKTTPPEQAILLHQALREQGTPTALVLYPSQGHGIKDFPDTAHFVAHLLCWLDHYLAVPAQP